MIAGMKKKLSAVAVFSLASLVVFVILKGKPAQHLELTEEGEPVVERVQFSGLKDIVKYDDLIKPEPHGQHAKSPAGNAKIKPRQRGQYAPSNAARKPLTTSDTISTTVIPPTSAVDLAALYQAVRLAHKLEKMQHRKRPSNVVQGDNDGDETGYITTEVPVNAVMTPVPEAVKFSMPPGNASRRYQYWLSTDDTSINLPYNVSVVTKQQTERKERIYEACHTPEIFEKLLPGYSGHRSNFVSHKHIMYCPILKAGSTNILRLLCWLRGPPCSTIQNLKPHNMVPRYLRKGGKIAVGTNKAFFNYFSFAIVRNPWRRLVSVYIQKFVETRQGIGFCGLKKRMPKLYNYYRYHRNETMSFRDYLEICVIGQDEEGGIISQNGHWRPQYQMCSFCELDYTFVGKIETMKSDERVILNAFGFKDVDQTIIDSNNHLLSNEKAGKTKLLYEDLWGEIDEFTLDRLRQIYTIDFKMFDYPTNPL